MDIETGVMERQSSEMQVDVKNQWRQYAYPLYPLYRMLVAVDSGRKRETEWDSATRFQWTTPVWAVPLLVSRGRSNVMPWPTIASSGVRRADEQRATLPFGAHFQTDQFEWSHSHCALLHHSRCKSFMAHFKCSLQLDTCTSRWRWMFKWTSRVTRDGFFKWNILNVFILLSN